MGWATEGLCLGTDLWGLQSWLGTDEISSPFFQVRFDYVRTWQALLCYLDMWYHNKTRMSFYSWLFFWRMFLKKISCCHMGQNRYRGSLEWWYYLYSSAGFPTTFTLCTCVFGISDRERLVWVAKWCANIVYFYVSIDGWFVWMHKKITSW